MLWDPKIYKWRLLKNPKILATLKVHLYVCSNHQKEKEQGAKAQTNCDSINLNIWILKILSIISFCLKPQAKSQILPHLNLITHKITQIFNESSRFSITDLIMMISSLISHISKTKLHNIILSRYWTSWDAWCTLHYEVNRTPTSSWPTNEQAKA